MRGRGALKAWNVLMPRGVQRRGVAEEGGVPD